MNRHTLRMTRILLTLALIALWAFTASAQYGGKFKSYDLRADFGLNPVQSKLQVRNLFSTEAAAQAKYPDFWAMCSQKWKWTGAQFMELSAFDAAWGQANWSGQGGGQTMTGYLSTSNSIVIPEGTYYITVSAEFSQGIYTGKGTGWTDVNPTVIATKLCIWHEEWNGDPNERHGLISGAWGQSGNLAYVESTIIERLSIDGRQDCQAALSAKFNGSGLRLWKPGEVSGIDYIRSDNNRTAGIETYAPTPLNIGTISVFSNVVAGVLGKGCWGGTINIDMLSGDDNGCLVMSIPGYMDEGGGTWNISTIKHENAVTAARVYRGHMVGYFSGQSAVNIGSISTASNAEEIDASIVLNAKLSNGNGQVCAVNVGAVKGYNYALSIQDVVNGVAYRSAGDYAANSFRYTNYGGGIMQSLIPLTKITMQCPDRLGATAINTAANYTTCTPVYRYIITGPPKTTNTIYLDGTPPPATCTWIPGTQTCSACVNNSQTCTTPYVPSVSGCTPTTAKPADRVETQACGTTPPPSSGALFTKSNPNITALNWRENLPAPVNVKRVVITGYKLNNDPNTGKPIVPNYHSIAFRDGTATGHLYALGSGFGFGGTVCPHTLVNGVLTINLPSPVQIVGIGSGTGGGCMLYSGTKLELFP